jgi:CDP-glycerol glycerophosphotransferase (TagB/SpsB family)
VRIAFLFNHDQIHQVAHSLPIALALAKADPSVEVIVATSNNKLRAEVDRMAGRLGTAANVVFVELRLRNVLSRCVADLLDRYVPAAKLAIYRDHLAFFGSLDALVVAEKTSAVLKSHYGLANLKLIHTRHGAGDRAIGFNAASAKFDHVLASGPKVRDRLISAAKVPPHRISIVGYPKFDLIEDRSYRLPLQSNGRPTVLYNPHVSPHLSSWYRHGRAVLDYFVDHPEYNLIFAPHVMLFERPFVVTIDKLRIDRSGVIERKYLDAPNVYIDIGSSLSTDMTYTMAADLYLGDVSSQVYEFLIEPRPCIFLNSHDVDFRGNPNYAHWQAGDVITRPAELGAALDRAWEGHADFAPVQERLFKETFDLTSVSSSERAAEAIFNFITSTTPGLARFEPALQISPARLGQAAA